MTIYICLICNKEQLITNIICSFDKDHYRLKYKNIEFDIIECKYCNSVQTYPIIDFSTFFNEDTEMKMVISDENINYDILYPKYVDDTNRRVKLLEKYFNSDSDSDSDLDNKKLLDIGCGYGFFVNDINKNLHHNITCVGIDISESRIKFAKENMTGGFLCSMTTDKEFVNKYAKSFDYITLFHVFEQIKDFNEIMNNLFLLLKPGGKIIIEVPNYNDQSLKEIKEYENFYYQVSQTIYFNEDSFNTLFSYLNNKNKYDNTEINYNISYIQRYGIMNNLHWKYHGMPQKYNPSYQINEEKEKNQEDNLYDIEQKFKNNRIKNKSSDTLLVEVSFN
jgi:2-polyprenyl-3-methyl-5-hydroxy-6-metoxy-1,4-benzoquinol methylase